MSGSIRHTPTGWVADVTVNGKRKTALCKTKREAISRKRELLEALLAKPATPIQLFSLQDARRLSLKVRWDGTSAERTAAMYSQAAVDYFGPHTLLSEITAPDVDAWRQKLLAAGNRPSTVNKKVSALRSMFNDAHLRGHIQQVPRFPQQLKLQNTKDRVLSDEETALFCQYFQRIGEPAAADCLVFLLETCARWGELEHLTGADIDLARRRVTFAKTKNNKVRSIPLTAKAVAAVEQHLPAIRTHRVFPYTYAQYRRLFEKAAEYAGVGDDPQLGIHTTRHTAASKMASAGVSLPILMQFGGWTSLASVQRYCHLSHDALAACVAALEG